MSDDLAVATAAAEAEISEEIKAFVPAMFQSRIPQEAIHSLSAKVAQRVLKALADAHAGTPNG